MLNVACFDWRKMWKVIRDVFVSGGRIIRNEIALATGKRFILMSIGTVIPLFIYHAGFVWRGCSNTTIVQLPDKIIAKRASHSKCPTLIKIHYQLTTRETRNKNPKMKLKANFRLWAVNKNTFFSFTLDSLLYIVAYEIIYLCYTSSDIYFMKNIHISYRKSIKYKFCIKWNHSEGEDIKVYSYLS